MIFYSKNVMEVIALQGIVVVSEMAQLSIHR
jgi:hypothetical protein